MNERIRSGFWDKSFDEILWHPVGESHMLLCGPTRSGKDRDIINPILLSFPGSCFVIDPKLQSAAVTARYRRDVLGQDVYIINPFNILPEYLSGFNHAHYDPMRSQLDPESDTFAIDTTNLMEGLMPSGGHEPHWTDSARLLGKGIAMYLREAYE